MRYFLKWIPVPGRIKDGNRVLRQDGIVEVVKGDLHASVLNRKRAKKAKLFLCSPDVSIGDITAEKTADGMYEPFEIHTELDIFSGMIERREQFNIIGLISPDALSLFRGDEDIAENDWIGPIIDRTNFKSRYFIQLKASDCKFY